MTAMRARTAAATVPAFRRALCAAGRGRSRRASWPRRRATPPPRRGSMPAPPRLIAAIRAAARRARRHRGFPARLFALHQGGPGADGAGRGAAARAGCRDRRPADRGQARGRRLVASRGQVRHAAGLGLGLGARHHGAHHPAGRDAGKHPRKPRQAARPAGGARGDAAGDAAARLAFRARPDASRRRSARAAHRPRVPLFLRHAGRGRAHARTTPSAISQPMRDAIEAIGRRAGNARAAGPARASRSSSRRCIRATRRSRASACCAS